MNDYAQLGKSSQGEKLQNRFKLPCRNHFKAPHRNQWLVKFMIIAFPTFCTKPNYCTLCVQEYHLLTFPFKRFDYTGQPENEE